ncbi:MAG: hypothetical protein ACI9BW_003328 [Gammaproteobacteria bacterium]|jgi:hypothetical protein
MSETATKVESSTGYYRVAQVEKMPSPDGAKGSWFQYVIEGGYAPVTGAKPGTQKQVSAYAKLLADELNARRSSGGASPSAPRGRKNQLVLK